MIFSTSEVLLYGRTPTLILFYFLHHPTAPILPVYVDQQWPHLEKDTTRSRRMCHRYDFLVHLYGMDLTFSNFLNFIFTWD